MTDLARLGGPIACFGLAVLLVATTRRDRSAGLGFTAFGAVVIGVAVAPHHRPLVLAGGVCVALALGLALAALYRRQPWLLPLTALACVPARIGVHVGSSSSKLLVPLYVVVLAATLLLAWDLLEGDERVRELGALSWPLAAYLLWTGLSLAWSKDAGEGGIEVLAFYVPFALLAVSVARLPWRGWGLRALAVEGVLMALVFTVVGFYQYQTRDIFQNPRVIYANAYRPFFRVNSVFWDPSVYGRFLVVALVAPILAIVLWRSARLALASTAVIVVVWVGLLISFSQSSFTALLVVVVGASFVAWRWRALVAVVLAAAVLAGMVAAQPQVRRSLQHHTTSGLNSATSGRYNLVANGIRIALHHPVLGVGVGGFRRAYADRVGLKGKDPRRAASHTTPVTVAAESGIVGLALFTWLVAAVLPLALRGTRPLGLVAGLGLGAILAHSLFYNAFFEDPMTWGLLGLAALAAARRHVRVHEPAPAQADEREAVPV